MANEAAQHLTDTAIQAASAKAPYLAGITAVIGGITLNDWLTIFGLIFMPLTFTLNWYMQNERLKIMRENNKNKTETGEEQVNDNSKE